MFTKLFLGAVLASAAAVAGTWHYSNGFQCPFSQGCGASRGSCCGIDTECCYPGSPCCEGETGTQTVSSDCCSEGAACCETGEACCAK